MLPPSPVKEHAPRCDTIKTDVSGWALSLNRMARLLSPYFLGRHAIARFHQVASGVSSLGLSIDFRREPSGVAGGCVCFANRNLFYCQ